MKSDTFRLTSTEKAFVCFVCDAHISSLIDEEKTIFRLLERKIKNDDWDFDGMYFRMVEALIVMYLNNTQDPDAENILEKCVKQREAFQKRHAEAILCRYA